MRSLWITIVLVLISTACQQTSSNTTANSEGMKRYPIKGKVVSVDKEGKKASIDHEAIEGFMDAMTMEFPIHADWVWDDLLPGAEIKGELVVDKGAKDPYWIENIGIIAAPNPDQPAPAINEKFAQVGKPIPDFELTDQDGKPISMKEFRGKALAITFIYAQCPLPDFCIRMSTNFSDLANQLRSDPDAASNVALLSISFDPARDTPAKLKQYGLGYMGKDAKDLGVWRLAVGKDAEVKKIADFFGLRYEVDPNDKTQFVHSLRTAVIGPDGKVTKIIPGNDWKPSDLQRELAAAYISSSK